MLPGTVEFERNGKVYVAELMFSADQIAEQVRRIAGEVTENHPTGEELVVVIVLRGAFMFGADLVRELDIPELVVDFIGLSSYGSRTESSGHVQITRPLDTNIDGKHVLIIEDIRDTALTMKFLMESLAVSGPKDIRTAVLFDKPSKHQVDVHVEHIGFTIDDVFIIGYGLDVDQIARGLPGVYKVIEIREL